MFYIVFQPKMSILAGFKMKKLIFFSILIMHIVYIQGRIEHAAYLRMYGYLTDMPPDSTVEPSQANMTRAISFYQQFNRLAITGVLDNPTLHQMAQPRCGCPDVMMNKDLQPLPFNLGPKWSKTDLTWKVDPRGFSRQLRQSQQLRAITDAFRVWSDVTPLTFRQVSNSQRADINILFASGQHGDGVRNSFDGRGRVLAHAFFPENGRVHFDEDEQWVIRTNAGTDLFTVAAHEFGHTLGLSHSEVQGALMAPYYQGYDPNFRLHTDDVRGIQQQYGPKVIPRPRPTPPRSTMKMTTSRTRTIPPPLPPNVDISCGARLKGIIRDFSGDALAFWNRWVIRMDDRTGVGNNIRRPIYTVFPGFPNRTPDAVFNVLSAGRVFLIRSMRIYQFKYRDGEYTLEMIGNRRSQWIGKYYDVPERPRAALAFSRNEIFMFGSSQAWEYDAYRNEIIPGSHDYISRKFPGIPNRIDAAVNWDYQTAFFISGTDYYKYDITSRRVLSGPTPVAPAFIKGRCGDRPK